MAVYNMVGFISFAAFVFLCSVTCISACKDLTDTFIEVRDYYKHTAMPRKYRAYKERASRLGIDLDNDEQIRDLACKLALAGSGDDVIDVLNMPPSDSEFISDTIGGFLYTYTMEIWIFKEVEEEYEAAFEFLSNTGFPNFPLGLSKEDILAFVSKAGRAGLDRVLDDKAPFTDRQKDDFAKALAEARTLENFSSLTSYRYIDVTTSWEERLEDMRARYTDAKSRPGVQSKLLKVLEKYGLHYVGQSDWYKVSSGGQAVYKNHYTIILCCFTILWCIHN